MAKKTVKERPLRAGEKWMLVLAEPLMLAIFTLPPFTLAFVLSNGRFDRMPQAIGDIAAWVEPVLVHFFEVTALIGAVLFMMAAATAFGLARKRQFDERTRIRILLAATGGLVIIAFLASLTVPVAAADARRWPEVAMVLAAAWVTLVAAQLIRFVTTPREKERTAKAAWRESERRARESGVLLAVAGVPSPMRWVCEITAWVAPVAVWVMVTLAIVNVFSLGGKFSDRVLLVGIVAFYGNLAIIMGWRATADLSMSPISRMLIRVAVMSYGLFASGSLGIALILTRTFAVLGLALCLFTVLHLLVYVVPTWRSHLPWLRVVEETKTRSAVARRKRAYKKLRALAA